MSTELITSNEFNGEVMLNVFWGGEEVYSQLTLSNYDKNYTQMSLENMISFFEEGLSKLKKVKE